MSGLPPVPPNLLSAAFETEGRHIHILATCPPLFLRPDTNKQTNTHKQTRYPFLSLSYPFLPLFLSLFLSLSLSLSLSLLFSHTDSPTHVSHQPKRCRPSLTTPCTDPDAPIQAPQPPSAPPPDRPANTPELVLTPLRSSIPEIPAADEARHVPSPTLTSLIQPSGYTRRCCTYAERVSGLAHAFRSGG